MRPPKQSLSGFTLVELILVVILIAIMSVSAARPLSNWSAYSTEVSLNELETALRYAHLYAIQTGCKVAVERFDDDNASVDAHPQAIRLRVTDSLCVRDRSAEMTADITTDITHPGTLDPYQLALEYSVTSTGANINNTGSSIHPTIRAQSSRNDHVLVTFYPEGHACNPAGQGQLTVRFVVPDREDLALLIDCATAYLERSRERS